METIASLNTRTKDFLEQLVTARQTHQLAIDLCAKHYSEERWNAIWTTETHYRAACARYDATAKELERAQMAAAGIR